MNTENYNNLKNNSKKILKLKQPFILNRVLFIKPYICKRRI